MLSELAPKKLWEMVYVEGRGFSAITWSPETMHLTLYTLPTKLNNKPAAYNTGLPERIIKRWQAYDLPRLSDDCFGKLTALEAARNV